MLKRLFRLMVGVAGGVALARYARTDKGRAALGSAVGTARETIRKALEPRAAVTPAPGAPETEQTIGSRIDEVQRRLRQEILRADEAQGERSDEAAERDPGVAAPEESA